MNLFYNFGEECYFLPEDKGPLPVILMSLGRSGSSVTWDTMSRMTGYPTVAYEATGQTRFNSKDFFSKINPTIGKKWASQRLCKIQERHPREAGVIGFQWKPYKATFKQEYAIGALEEMAEHINPAIRVIYLKRNALDRRVSNLRHAKDPHVSAHCAMGDKVCVREHIQNTQNITIPTGDELLRWMRTYKVTDNLIRDQLSMSGIQHISISYDKLYRSNDAEEWMRLFSFLGRGPDENLKLEDVRAHFAMAPTSIRSRAEVITNFDDVLDTLTDTEFQYLLYS